MALAMSRRFSIKVLRELGIQAASKKRVVFEYFADNYRPQDIIHSTAVGKRLTPGTVYRYHKEWLDKAEVLASLAERGLL